MRFSLWIALLLFCNSTLEAQLGLKKISMPGMVPIKGDYLYMDIGEVSNINYVEFLWWLELHHLHDSFLNNHPDTTVWRSKLGWQEPFVDYYLKHPAYKDYPVVGITQKQAENFCRWRRDRILEAFRERGIPVEDIIVRLPTREEWEYAARGGLPNTAMYPWPGEEIRIKGRDIGKYKTGSENYRIKSKNVGMIRANMLRARDDLAGIAGGIVNDAGFITTPVYSYWPNGYGLYNMCGNVAEWVSEPGINKGGSWRSEPYYCRIQTTSLHDGDLKPKDDIGFRCVIEIAKVNSKSNALQLNARIIEDEFSPQDQNIRAAVMEVRNTWYRQFLMETGMTQFAPDDSLWLTFDAYQWHLMYSEYAGFDEYPVVNISYEAALAYCEWLTKKYQSFPDRKYAGKQVTFRLPTEDEWLNMACGGRIGNSYPWGGPYTRNSRGCFLANFHPKPEAYFIYDSTVPAKRTLLPYDTSAARSADGVEFTCRTDSYFPNNYGLYNCSGNVAEMLAEKGISCGGSWNSDAKHLLVKTYAEEGSGGIRGYPETYSGPLPTLGFRVIMEIR